MRFLYSRFTFIGLLIIAVVTCIQLTREVVRRYTINTQIDKIESEIDSLQAKQFELKQIISYLKSDVYLEEEARKKLNLRRMGESVYMIPNENSPTSTVSKTSVSLTAAGGWWHYFFAKETPPRHE